MRRPLSVFCVLTAAVLWLSVLLMPYGEPDLSSLEGKIVTLSAVVDTVEWMAGEPGSGVSCRIFLKKTNVPPGNSHKCGILLQPEAWEEVPEPGDRITVRGRFRLFRQASNEGEFDPAQYYRSKGIGGRLTEVRLLARQAGRTPAAVSDRCLFRIRTALGETIDRCFERDDAGLMRALLLGERRMAEDDLLDLYRQGGVMHLLVISGMHISLLGTALLFLSKKLRCPPAAGAVLSGTGVLVYGRMAGVTASVFRAVWMFEMRLLAPCFGRTYDLATAVSLAAVLLLITHPLFLLQSGFLFSFSAVFGLALLAPAMPEKLSFAAIPAATLPIHLWFYYGYAPYGVLLTLLFAPFLPVLLASGAAVCFVGRFLPSVGKAAALPAHLVLLFYKAAVETAERLPGAFLITGRPGLWKIALYYGVVLVSLYAGRGNGSGADRERTVTREDRRRAAGKYALRFMGIMAAVVFLMVHGERGLTVSFLDVGQGDGICLQEGNTAILVDGGSSSRQDLGENVLLPFLKYKGISRLDLLLLTHEDYDHCSGMMEILEQVSSPDGIKVGAVALPDIASSCREERYRQIEKLAQEKEIPVLYYSAGDVLRAGKMTLECLHPSAGAAFGDANEGSGVFLLCRGEFSALLTGDLEGVGEDEVVRILRERGPLQLTVLKAAHHGSAGATGEAFLDLVQAEYAVISCGKDNLYGHPAKETVERLEAAGCKILDTRECGEIVFRGDRNRPFVFRPVGRQEDLR